MYYTLILISLEIAYKDDLESLVYVMIFFINGGILPWQRRIDVLGNGIDAKMQVQ